MILLISTCKHKLHELEFVKPIEHIVNGQGQKVTTVHFTKITDKDIKEADRIIICGTALKDFDYLQDMKGWHWLKGIKNPVLGICAGAQIIAKILDIPLTEDLRTGLQEVGGRQQYFLHQKGLKEPIIKHKNFTAVLFHPEVMDKKFFQLSFSGR